MALTDDDSAADTLPLALAGTVLLVAVIFALAASGMRNALPAVEAATVDRQADAIANDCRFLLSLGARHLDDPGSPPGAMRNVEIDLPEGTEYLSFGYDPATGGGHGGTIYYKVSGSKKALVVDERVMFLATEGDHAILGPGRYDLCFEYASDALGRRYILIPGP